MAATKRTLKPRPPVATAPLFVSQLNCLALAGIDARRYLELLPVLGVRVAEVGRLRLVDADELRAALRDLATGEETTAEPRITASQPETADEILAHVGMRKAAR